MSKAILVIDMPQNCDVCDFARMVKQGVFCVTRTVIYEQDHMKIIDVQLLEVDGRTVVLNAPALAAS